MIAPRDSVELRDVLEPPDMDFVMRALRQTYWAADRDPEVTRRAFEGSLGFVLREGERVIGCARVITDGAWFSWLSDVFIEPEHRGRGLGTWMVEAILAHPRVRSTRVHLRTEDAGAFYRRLAFQPADVWVRGPVNDGK